MAVIAQHDLEAERRPVAARATARTRGAPSRSGEHRAGERAELAVDLAAASRPARRCATATSAHTSARATAGAAARRARAARAARGSPRCAPRRAGAAQASSAAAARGPPPRGRRPRGSRARRRRCARPPRRPRARCVASMPPIANHGLSSRAPPPSGRSRGPRPGDRAWSASATPGRSTGSRRPGQPPLARPARERAWSARRTRRPTSPRLRASSWPRWTPSAPAPRARSGPVVEDEPRAGGVREIAPARRRSRDPRRRRAVAAVGPPQLAGRSTGRRASADAHEHRGYGQRRSGGDRGSTHRQRLESRVPSEPCRTSSSSAAGSSASRSPTRRSERGVEPLVLDAGRAARRRTSRPGCWRRSRRRSSARRSWSRLGLESPGAATRRSATAPGRRAAQRPARWSSRATPTTPSALDRLHAYRAALGLDCRAAAAERSAPALEPALAPTVRLALDVPGDASVDPRALLAALRDRVPVRGARRATAVAGRTVATATRRPPRASRSSSPPAPGRPTSATSRAPRQGPDPAPARPARRRASSSARSARSTRYLVPRGDGRYVLGGTVEDEGWDDEPTARRRLRADPRHERGRPRRARARARGGRRRLPARRRRTTARSSSAATTA